MAAVTRLGLSATPRGLYGDFSGKTEAVVVIPTVVPAVIFETKDVTLAIRNILRGDHTHTDSIRNVAQQTLRNIVEDRVYVGRAPQRVKQPYVLVSILEVVRGYHMLAENDTAYTLVSIDVYSHSRREMFIAWDAIRQQLTAFRGTVSTKDGDVCVCSGLFDGEGEDNDTPPDGSDRFTFIYSGIIRVNHDQIVPDDFDDGWCGIGCMIIESTDPAKVFQVGPPTSTLAEAAAISAPEVYTLAINTDITTTEWDTYRSALATGAEGRPVGANATYHEHDVTATYQPYRIGATESYEVPTMVTLADGTLGFRCDRSLTPSQDDHSQVTPRSAYGQIEDAFYLKPYRDFRIEWSMVINDDDYSEAQWLAHPWCILLDLHPGTFPGTWTDTTEPLVAISVEGGGFRCRTRGSTQAVPVSWTRNDSDDWTFALGEQHFCLQARWDYTGDTGKVKLWHGSSPGNRVVVANRTGSVGFNHSAATTAGSLFPKFGCYTSTDGPVTFLKDITIYDETNE